MSHRTSSQPSSSSAPFKKANLSKIAHMLYYWPFPSDLQKEATQEHIIAKHTLLDIAQDLQQRFLQKMILKHRSHSVHPWLITQLTTALMPYMVHYATTHSSVEYTQTMISMSFFQPSPHLPSEYSKSTDPRPLPSPTSSEGTNIEC